ncbi:MAG TPA: glycosyltransferase family 4 protein [Candidatus Eisenbergiella intestinipullorum]|nr:glycosyltransferase family 4 protein [Candidatus Eisenbergiella intestinipullorum]
MREYERMKKALIITTISGFVPQFEKNHVSLLQEKGYEVHYASNFDRPVYDHEKDFFRKNGIITHPLSIEKSPVNLLQNARAFGQLKRLLKREHFDLIHCHNPMGGALGRTAAGLYSPGSVILYTAHGFHFYKKAPWKNWLLYYPAERALARLTDILITVNEEDHERGKRFCLRRGGSVWKIPGVGVDVERFIPQEEERSRRKAEYGFPEDSFLLLSAGELNRNKNHRAVIRAVAQMKDQNIYYGICGRGSGRKSLEAWIRREGLQERVRLLGYRKDMERILPAADCFLFPSRREGFGMAAVEAMASGLALITSDCRGTREYMKDGITGFICERNRPESYAEAVQRLRDDPAGHRSMEKESRRQALCFSRQATESIMRQIYEKASEWRQQCPTEKLPL